MQKKIDIFLITFLIFILLVITGSIELISHCIQQCEISITQDIIIRVLALFCLKLLKKLSSVVKDEIKSIIFLN